MSSPNKNWKLLFAYMVIPRVLWRNHMKNIPGKFQRLPNVTTRLQKTSDSKQRRDNREKCQRIIDYVFGNGPFPYSDVTGISEVHKEHIAQIIAQQKHNAQEETNKDTDGEQHIQNKENETVRVETEFDTEKIDHITARMKQKPREETNKETDGGQQIRNKEDEIIKLETVVTSEDQPDIVAIRKVKKVHSSDNQTDSLVHDEEAHLTVVDGQEAKSNNEDFIKPKPYSEGQNPKINKVQESHSIQKMEPSTIIQTKPFQLIQIKPLSTYDHKITDIKCHDKINTTDDEFLYENSCGEEIHKEAKKRSNKILKKEITSNIAEYGENIQDNTKKNISAENAVKAITGVKENEKKYQGITIKDFTSKNTENSPNKITENETKLQDTIIHELPGVTLKKSTSTKRNDEQLKPIMEKSEEMLLFDIPVHEPKGQSNPKTRKKKVECSSKTEQKSNDNILRKVMKSNHNSIGDDGIIQMELFMPINRSAGSSLYKAQTKTNAKTNISDKENKNARNLSFSLISNNNSVSRDKQGINTPEKIMRNSNCKFEEATCIKEPSANREEVLIHCNKSTSIETPKILSKAMESMEALGKRTEDTEIMNDKTKLKLIEDKKGQDTENMGNPFKNTVVDPNTFYFDHFANRLQDHVYNNAAKEKNPDRAKKIQRKLEESEEELPTDHAVSFPCNNQLSPKEKTNISPTLPATLPVQQKCKLFNTSQQYPQQHAWSISHRHPVQMYSPKKFFIQNRPSNPPPNEYVWKIPKRRPLISRKNKKKVDSSRNLLGLSYSQLQQQRNPAPSKEKSSTVEHRPGQVLWPGDASIEQHICLQQHYSHKNNSHRHKSEKKPDKSSKPFTYTQPDPKHEPETKQHEPVSTKENIPLELQNRHEEKHELDYHPNLEEEDLITQVKKQLSQWYASEIMNDTEMRLNSKNQKEEKDLSDKQGLEPNESKMLQEICTSTVWPVPEFKITNDMPLSEMMKAIRMRNQFLFIKEFLESVEMSKCGDKKPDCPPKAPVCCPQKPAPPVQQSPPPPPTPPPPCTPVPKKPKPPPKCNCKCKYVGVKDMFDVLPCRISAPCSIDVPAAEFLQPDQQEPEDVWVDSGSSVVFAGSFDPWVPIPNYPYPKKDVKGALQGCDPRCKQKEIPIYVKPKEKPCTGFPKRLSFSSKRLNNFAVPCYLN